MTFMARQEPTRIYMGDLIHNYLGSGSYMFPLNIGFVSSYAQKVFGDQIQISLFKYPEELIQAIRDNPPDVLGLSNYMWNSHLNNQISQRTKDISDNILIVYGGPDINLYPQGYREFFHKRPFVDSYILCEGERGFANLLQTYIKHDRDLEATKAQPVDGCVSFLKGTQVGGSLLDRIEDLDAVPSPYLTGLLDQFFDYPLIPIIETNRGCPFSCTFCAQGLTSRHMVRYFPLSRVLAELEYIAQHVQHTNLLCIADANFGIHKRDITIGEKIKDLSDRNGYPRRCIINWIKTRKAIDVAERMGQATYLISSLQSMDPVVQRNIKRHNIDTTLFREIIDYVNTHGGISGTEIILGLPGETRESHSENLRELFRWGVSYIICYNALIIGGSELALPSEREKYRIHTGFRLIDSAFGRYGDILSFEAEEGVRSTSTMTEEEILFFRPVHWLIQFCWNYRAYYEVLKFALLKGINPFDFIVALIDRIHRASPVVQNIMADFRKEAREEWFGSPELLIAYYSQPEHFEFLRAGGVGKMNSKYIWRILLECKQEFDTYVRQVTMDLLPDADDVVPDLLRFTSSSFLDFSRHTLSTEPFRMQLTQDIVGWRKNRYEGFPRKRDVTYEFFIPDDKRKALSLLLAQYEHDNPNVMMRKMSEHMRFDDLYYEIHEVP